LWNKVWRDGPHFTLMSCNKLWTGVASWTCPYPSFRPYYKTNQRINPQMGAENNNPKNSPL
jgi:hypothetical protein